ncbi:hypothetical protein ACWDWO_16350 [Actinopolymorpha singaporensis]|uniref:Uncharacterized protein n=1 Tax=Actinopolymorpha singaporensis TaxID=117157 RepID=A0A1H1RXS1_9ACTN|nr:hypothetical protein [Actinopolymorpha singaporensis]SDS40485.1 hypothetical protein SAMN04489717_2591 [Actinopolymorpha singaporensis]
MPGSDHADPMLAALYPAFRDWLGDVDTDALTDWTPRPCFDGN